MTEKSPSTAPTVAATLTAPAASVVAKGGPKIQKLCTLWIHDEQFSSEEVLFDPDKFADCGITAGSLVKIFPIKTTTAVRDFGSGSGLRHAESNPDAAPPIVMLDEAGRRLDALRAGDAANHLVFICRPPSAEVKSRYGGLNLSLLNTIAIRFGFRNRTQMVVTRAEEETHRASHVELTFRDQHLTRSDMWRLAMADLYGKSLYRGQRINFINTIKATIKNIYIEGHNVNSAVFSSLTKPIFRSESARYVIFLQMSREMWDFDDSGAGHINFTKVVDGFLPALFRKWNDLNARHIVSVIMFTRMACKKPNTDGKPYRDFYRTVVTNMSSTDWATILRQLKKEFTHFFQDVVSTMHAEGVQPGVESSELPHGNEGKDHSTQTSADMLLPASQGNILEAIGIVASHLSRDHFDRDLVRTGLSIVVITPGRGVFEVEYGRLQRLTEDLSSNAIGIDLVCLSNMPLHSVPIFKYQTPMFLKPNEAKEDDDGSTLGDDHTPRQKNSHLEFKLADVNLPSPKAHCSYALPHWIDVSFWISLNESRGSPEFEMSKVKKQYRRRVQQKKFIPRSPAGHLNLTGPAGYEVRPGSTPHLHGITMPRSFGGMESSKDEIISSRRAHYQQSMQGHGKDGPKDSNDKTSDAAISKTMGRYDVVLFQNEQVNKSPTLVSPGRPDHYRSPSDSRQLSGNFTVRGHTHSFYDEDGHFQNNNTRHGSSSYLEHVMREQKSDRRRSKSPAARDHHRPLSSGKTRMGNREKPLRHLSFGPKGFSTLKSSASAALSLLPEDLDSGHKMTRSEHSLGEESASSKENSSVSTAVRATLARNPTSSNRVTSDSDSTVTSPVATVTEAGFASSPIAIRQRLDAKDASYRSPARFSGQHARQTSRDSELRKTSTASVSTSTRNGVLGEEKDLITNDEIKHDDLFPWLTLVNPTNPRKENMSVASQYRRWQHVFPHPVKSSTIKWKSLCSPAAIPLTNEFLPSPRQLVENYTTNHYRITHLDGEDANVTLNTRQALIREMIALRLLQGFQLVVHPEPHKTGDSQSLTTVDIFNEKFMTEDMSSLYMILGNTIHQLSCVPEDMIEVKTFERKPIPVIGHLDTGRGYTAMVKSSVSQHYEPRPIPLPIQRPPQDWNTIDNYLAGHSDKITDVPCFWRARFVLIPIHVPPAVRRRFATGTELSEEEIRLEGIHKLTQLWQRNTYRSATERKLKQGPRAKRDANPLKIEYQTRDPSAVVSSGGFLTTTDPDGERHSSLDDDLYEKPTYELSKIASHLQRESGVPIQDRWWHLRRHESCFVGSDLVTWLVQHFSDIETREDAESLGEKLRNDGLFTHVQLRHNFRDGNYFYQIASKHRAPRAETRAGWFGRKTERSVPATPSTDGPANSPFIDRLSRPTSSTDESLDSSDAGGDRTPTTRTPRLKPLAALSNMLKYDLDPRRRSYRPEIVNLHYDKLHNPDNCYHVRIDWMNATTKLIEDAVVNWASLAERYGLKFVEVPMTEAVTTALTHPFRSPITVKLALAPPTTPSNRGTPRLNTSLDSPSTVTVAKEEYRYHKSLLRKLNFVLDLESATSFPTDVEVKYSWGRPDYQHSQYIHRSGVCLAQILDATHILLAPNRLYNHRLAAIREIDKFKPDAAERRAPTGGGPPTAPGGLLTVTPIASPLIRPTTALATSALADDVAPGADTDVTTVMTMEAITAEVETLCSDPVKLKELYEAEERRVESDVAAATKEEAAVVQAPSQDEEGIPHLGLGESLLATSKVQ